MKGSKITAVLLACAVAAMTASGVAAKGKPKHPRYNERYDCAKAIPVKLINTYFRSWEGDVVLKGKAVKNVYSDGGGSACKYKYADGPYAGRLAGSVVLAYGKTNAPRIYKSDEYTARHNSAQACANGNPTGDPRYCAPVELSGVGTHAYESGSYIAAVNGKVFVQLAPGPGVANGQYIPSSTLPPADMLENAMKAVLAKLN